MTLQHQRRSGVDSAAMRTARAQLRAHADHQARIHRHTAEATSPSHPEMAAWHEALADAYLALATENVECPPELLPILGDLVTEITKIQQRQAEIHRHQAAATAESAGCTWCPTKESAGTVHGDPLCADCLGAHREEADRADA